ncbi:MAG: MTH1187 family thiamine-binding protein [Acidobacteriia bacterium]|nr:MTH1187 family thiamine-binding protein [Terriglobia bacterium]
MLLELNILPLGRGRSIGNDIADVVKIIDASGLDYKLTAEGTILEGNWDQLMDVAKKCHNEMRKKTDRVVTIMHADDYADHTGRLNAAVDSVAKKLGKPVKR